MSPESGQFRLDQVERGDTADGEARQLEARGVVGIEEVEVQDPMERDLGKLGPFLEKFGLDPIKQMDRDSMRAYAVTLGEQADLTEARVLDIIDELEKRHSEAA